MAKKPCDEPINLLVIAENFAIQDSFIRDLKGFLQDENYNPVLSNKNLKSWWSRIDNNTIYSTSPRTYDVASTARTTSFWAYFHNFYIIGSPIFRGCDSPNVILHKTNQLQDMFMEPLNMKAIIFLMQPNPTYYEHFLSLNLFKNFINNNIAKMKETVMFVFAHKDPVFESSMADADLRAILKRIGAGLVHSTIFQYHSNLNRKFCNEFVKYIFKNKEALHVETFYSHNSAVKVIENEDFLDLLLEALFLNEDNIYSKATGENKLNYLEKRNDYRTVCTNQNCLKFQYCCDCSKVKTKSQLELCDVLKNASTCTNCNCPISNHKAVKYYIYQSSATQTKEQQENYRHALITLLVTVDLFQKENKKSVCQLYGRLKERVKQKAHYSILETMYKDAMGCAGIKRITADECIKCIFKMLPHLKGFRTVEYELGQFLSMPERNLMVK